MLKQIQVTGHKKYCDCIECYNLREERINKYVGKTVFVWFNGELVTAKITKQFKNPDTNMRQDEPWIHIKYDQPHDFIGERVFTENIVLGSQIITPVGVSDSIMKSTRYIESYKLELKKLADDIIKREYQ